MIAFQLQVIKKNYKTLVSEDTPKFIKVTGVFATLCGAESKMFNVLQYVRNEFNRLIHSLTHSWPTHRNECYRCSLWFSLSLFSDSSQASRQGQHYSTHTRMTFSWNNYFYSFAIIILLLIFYIRGSSIHGLYLALCSTMQFIWYQILGS